MMMLRDQSLGAYDVFYTISELESFLKIECPEDYATMPDMALRTFRTWDLPQGARFEAHLAPLIGRLLLVGTDNSGRGIYAYLTPGSIALSIGNSSVRPTPMAYLTHEQLHEPFCFLGSTAVDLGEFKALATFHFWLPARLTGSKFTLKKDELRRACA
jgi:hypothetical protein